MSEAEQRKRESSLNVFLKHVSEVPPKAISREFFIPLCSLLYENIVHFDLKIKICINF